MNINDYNNIRGLKEKYIIFQTVKCLNQCFRTKQKLPPQDKKYRLANLQKL